MSVDYYTCSNCRDTYPDCGPCWSCENGHSIGPCCLDDRKEYEQDDDGYITAKDCPCCAKGGTELERTKAELTVYREALLCIQSYVQASGCDAAYFLVTVGKSLQVAERIRNPKTPPTPDETESK